MPPTPPTIDELIDGILKVFEDRQQHDVEAETYQRTGVADPAIGERVREKMIRKGLIEPYTHDGDIITDEGMEVLEAGGWLVYIGKAKSQEQLKLDQLVLDVQNLKAQPKRYWLTTILTAVTIGFGVYGFVLDGRLSGLKEELRIERLRIDSLSNVQADHGDLLKTTDTQIQKLEKDVEGIDSSLKPSKKKK